MAARLARLPRLPATLVGCCWGMSAVLAVAAPAEAVQETAAKAADSAAGTPPVASFNLLEPANIPLEGLLIGGVLLALLVAFLAHRIAHAQSEVLRWALIVICVLGAAGGVNWISKAGQRLQEKDAIATVEVQKPAEPAPTPTAVDELEKANENLQAEIDRLRTELEELHKNVKAQELRVSKDHQELGKQISDNVKLDEKHFHELKRRTLDVDAEQALNNQLTALQQRVRALEQKPEQYSRPVLPPTTPPGSSVIVNPAPTGLPTKTTVLPPKVVYLPADSAPPGAATPNWYGGNSSPQQPTYPLQRPIYPPQQSSGYPPPVSSYPLVPVGPAAPPLPYYPSPYPSPQRVP